MEITTLHFRDGRSTLHFPTLHFPGGDTVIDLARFLSGRLVRRDGSPKRHCIVDLPRLPDSGPSEGVRWQLQLSTVTPPTVRIRMLTGGRKPGTKATPAVRFDFPPKTPADVHVMLLREGVEVGPLLGRPFPTAAKHLT